MNTTHRGRYAAPRTRNPFYLLAALAAGMLLLVGACADTKAVADEPEPEVVTETVEVTPTSCLDALDHAESAFGQASMFATVTSTFPGMIEDALYAFDADAINALTDEIIATTAAMDEVTAETTAIMADYEAAAAECRSAS